ncbi:MAG TPA: lysylphosphatidylglycerol synthase domain-containing protein [Solimonas sp.]|nr:lysylphosphatidylglycerol synthase domain-containing protein [Solimonas sp.]
MVESPAPRPLPLRAGLFGLVVLVAYGALIEWLVGWASLAQSVIQAGAMPALLVLAGLLASYLLRALRIRAAAASGGGLLETARIFALYNLSNWLMPARLGEASLPLLLQRRHGLPLARGSGVLLWLRLLDLHVIGVLAGAVLLQLGGAWRGLGLLALAAGLLGPPLVLRLLDRIAARWPRARSLAAALPASPQAAAGDLGLAWAAWTVKLCALGAALSLIAGLSYPAGMLGALGGDVSAVLPLHAPLGAGSYEAGVLLALAPWQPEWKPALAAAVQLHALLLSAALLLGGLSLPSLQRRAPD